MAYTFICAACGEEFTTNRSNSKTCSPKCYREYRRILEKERRHAKKQPKTEIPCKHCGEMFIPRDTKNVYCCRECKEEAAKLRRHREAEEKKKLKKRKAPTVKCGYCGKVFKVTPDHKRYCSIECREEAVKILRQESYERNKKKILKEKGRLGLAITAHEAGMSYAEAQVLDTLSRVPPIKRSL